MCPQLLPPSGSARSGDFVLVIAHCGLEYIPFPPTYVTAAFRSMVEAGADCVIGHHPHVPQGIEWYQGRPIAYSLGNFVFYQHTDLVLPEGGILHPSQAGRQCPPEPGDIALPDYRNRSADARHGGRKTVSQKMARISKPLHTRGGAEKAWEAYLAYYGLPGFTSEVLGIVERMKSEPQKAAAMFRNRITTLQHAELWRDFLTRIVNEERRPYSKEAFREFEEWFTKTTT